jgi:hypothetical protein
LVQGAAEAVVGRTVLVRSIAGHCSRSWVEEVDRSIGGRCWRMWPTRRDRDI